MSIQPNPDSQLKVISLSPKIIIVNKIENSSEQNQDVDEEGFIVAPIMFDKDHAIEDIGSIVEKVYSEFSKACNPHNLSWEAEIEVGLEFGVKFSAKLKIFQNKN